MRNTRCIHMSVRARHSAAPAAAAAPPPPGSPARGMYRQVISPPGSHVRAQTANKGLPITGSLARPSNITEFEAD